MSDSSSSNATATAIQLKIAGPIATLTINKPERGNSLAKPDIEAFIALLDAVDSGKGDYREVRVLVLTGAGEKTFCSGASLDQLSSGDMDGDIFATLTNRLATLDLPVICALNGSVYGGGTEIAICCDFRIGVEGMRQFIPAARFSLCYPASGIARLVQTLGLHTAKRMLLSCEQSDAEQLLALGFLTRLVARKDFAAAVDELAANMANLGPLSVRAMKQISNHIAESQTDAAQIRAWVDACNQSADLQEGLQAASEKRSPQFSGR